MVVEGTTSAELAHEQVLNELETADRLAELNALVRVAQGMLPKLSATHRFGVAFHATAQRGRAAEGRDEGAPPHGHPPPGMCALD
jgi:hypothetical protein